MNTGKILLGILAGATVGAALGVLFAPEKGTIARDQISQKSGDIWDTIKCKIEDYISSIGKEAKNVKEEAEDLYAKGKDKLQEEKNNIKNAANAGTSFH